MPKGVFTFGYILFKNILPFHNSDNSVIIYLESF